MRIQVMFENGAVLPVEMSVDAGAAPHQAKVIPVSQNRRSRRDRLTAERNCEVNLKAVLAIMLLHDKLIS